MCSAEELLVVLNTVTDNTASAVEAGWGESLNRTLKAIEGIGATGLKDVEGFVVSVVANNTGTHTVLNSSYVGSPLCGLRR